MAAAELATETWDEEDWQRFGRSTGTTDILWNHPRLCRSLSFGDDDYPRAVLNVLETILTEGVEKPSETARMKLIAETMPELPESGLRRTPHLASNAYSPSTSTPAM